MLVRIDRATLKINQTAGRCHHDMVRVVKLANGMFRRKDYVADGAPDNLVWQLIQVSTHASHPNGGVDVTQHSETDTQRVYSAYPEASHTFWHENPPVCCVECGEITNLESLDSDSYDDDEGVVWTNQKCPCCGCWQATGEDLKYETLHDCLAADAKPVEVCLESTNV